MSRRRPPVGHGQIEAITDDDPEAKPEQRDGYPDSEPGRRSGHLGELDQDNASLDGDGWVRKLFGDYAPFTAMFNITGQPAISLPLAWSDEGLPVGVQLVGRYGDEASLLRVASQLEQIFPWSGRLPPTAAG